MQALEFFKAIHDNKAFTLTHCWLKIKDCQKWKVSYALYLKTVEASKKNGKASTSAIDVDATPSNGGRAERARGHKAAKGDLKRDAQAHLFQESLKEIMTEKEKAAAEREERRRKDTEAAVAVFVDLQKRTLEVAETNAKSRMMEASAKVMAQENTIMFTDLDKVADPIQRAWIAKRQAEIRARLDV